MPEQPPKVRARNFQEVALGYTPEMARIEAARCLQCKKPACRKGCPVEVDIPGFIKQLVAGEHDEAYAVLRRTNSLPAVCGRVCPQENQCEGACILGKKGEPVAIGPVPMMRAVAEATRPFGVKTTVSLNSIMVDGIGMCGACRVSVGGQTRFACVDGPEFDGHAVDFTELAARLTSFKDQERLSYEEFKKSHVCNCSK